MVGSLNMVLQMNWEVARFLIWLCLVGFGTAKCIPESCGSINLSYPFWIRHPDCGYPGFQLKCMQNSTGVFAPFLTAAFVENNNGDANTDFEILEINYTGALIISSTSLKAMSCNRTNDAFVRFMLPSDGPFTISSANIFLVVGCNSEGSFTVENDGDSEGSCKSACLNQYDPKYCNTYGCCEAGIPGNRRMVNFTGGGIRYEAYKECGFSTILDPLTWTVPPNEGGAIAGGRYGLRLDWKIGQWNCTTANRTSNYSCAKDAECLDSGDGGHLCKCLPGYDGNGYSNGTACTDVDECNHEDSNDCLGSLEGGVCQNLKGSYNCSCAEGYTGDGFHDGTRCTKSTNSNNALISAIIVSFGAWALFWWLRRRRLKEARDKNFQQNGGIQLQEHISSMGGRKTLTIFCEKELEIASNNYSVELGKGGFATVYKGVLLDSTAVAIKKPKSISDEFINEIVIFSYINHRNVVKLLGCCLETQYPLIVYEFVPNGTLFEHLHSAQMPMVWDTRRQIAIETADAIAYMHLQASQPIFHRDIKSSNILLDNTFTPKVADFGISRLRPFDETHLSTMAVGTRGYVDPEFVRSNRFTDKSDVFSFGVVLVELLTGLEPLLSLEETVCTLYDHFVTRMNQNHLIEILDPNVVNKENQQQMEDMARLARACLQVKAKARPSMRQVVEELAVIRARQSGLYKEVSLLEHRGDLAKAKQKDYSFQGIAESTSEDHYLWSAPSDIIMSEDPSTSLIQMSNMYAR